MSDWRVLPEALDKRACCNCGLVVRSDHTRPTVASYANGYQLYDHPPAAGFEAERQAQYPRWIHEAVQRQRARIFDAAAVTDRCYWHLVTAGRAPNSWGVIRPLEVLAMAAIGVCSCGRGVQTPSPTTSQPIWSSASMSLNMSTTRLRFWRACARLSSQYVGWLSCVQMAQSPDSNCCLPTISGRFSKRT